MVPAVVDRPAVGAPLAHAAAMTEPGALDDEGDDVVRRRRCALRRRTRRVRYDEETDEHGHGEHDPTHVAEP